MQEAMVRGEAKTNFKGPLPPQMQERLRQQRAGELPPSPNDMTMHSVPDATKLRTVGSPQLEEILARITTTQMWDEVLLPSRGLFYGNAIPDGHLHIRPMTGEEEQILATPKYVRNGTAMNMIFKRCIKEDIDPSLLLSMDRTFLLIYLRGSSYTKNYDVEIKCPSCTHGFSYTIDLDHDISVEDCPQDFGPHTLTGVTPDKGLHFTYRLSTGRDEVELQKHRESRGKNADSLDDTLHFRTAQLLVEVEGLTDKRDLLMLLAKMPVGDGNYLRNIVTNPPFGVNTKVDIGCPMCLNEFQVELPMETSFFFPRLKRGQTVE
jgi:hypothetical protein